jgi:hypothetical protein
LIKQLLLTSGAQTSGLVGTGGCYLLVAKNAQELTNMFDPHLVVVALAFDEACLALPTKLSACLNVATPVS